MKLGFGGNGGKCGCLSDLCPFFPTAPARLLNYSCLLKRTLTCSCSFHGIPTPSVQWWVGEKPANVNSTDAILHTTTSTLEPWTNSSIHLMWEPEIIRRLRCEGKNQYGVHTSRIFLIPGEWREVWYDWDGRSALGGQDENKHRAEGRESRV